MHAKYWKNVISIIFDFNNRVKEVFAESNDKRMDFMFK